MSQFRGRGFSLGSYQGMVDIAPGPVERSSSEEFKYKVYGSNPGVHHKYTSAWI